MKCYGFWENVKIFVPLLDGDSLYKSHQSITQEYWIVWRVIIVFSEYQLVGRLSVLLNVSLI